MKVYETYGTLAYRGALGDFNFDMNRPGGLYRHTLKRLDDASARAQAQTKMDPGEHLANAMMRRLTKICSLEKAAATVAVLFNEGYVDLAIQAEAYLMLSMQDLR